MASWSLLQDGLAVGGIIALWLACVTAALTVRRYWRVARFALPDADVHLTADDAALVIDDHRGARRHTWSDIPWVLTGGGHVFMQTAAREAIIVPLRAFEDETCDAAIRCICRGGFASRR